MIAVTPVPALTIRLFGVCEVLVDGQPLPRLRSRKGHWLLALLVLRPGHTADRAWLAGTLWPDSDEAAAFANLRSTLKDLRRAFGAEAHRLHAPDAPTGGSPRALGLDLQGAAVDLLAFDRAIAAGDPASLEQAVALYRGPLLQECAEAWALDERGAREADYLRALESLAATAVAAGDDARAVAYLRRAVAVDPLREDLQRGVMHALAASGSYAAAFAVYRDLRLRLHRALNVEPDPETAALFQQLRGAAREATAARRKRNLATEVTEDTEKESLGATVAHDSPSSVTSVTSVAKLLPIPPTPLIGREQEVATIRKIVERDDVRLVTLTGVGGSGKTRVALKVAALLSERFPDGVCFVDLSAIRDPALVLSTIAQALGVHVAGEGALESRLKENLREKRCLLLLDNFEQILDAAPRVSELLAVAPHLKVLVTSRAALRLRGEQEFPVPPLAVPDPRDLPPLNPLSRCAAVELFVRRAANVNPGFTLTSENAPAVAEICRRLDGLPLAIELAAARTRLLAPRSLLARLSSRLTLLTDGARDLPARQQTLRNTIAWSYDLLDEETRRLFAALSVFVGGWTLEAVEQVCDGSLDRLATLVEQSLVHQRDGADGEPRFTMLETIAEFARERLAAESESAEFRRRHTQYFLSFAEAIGDQLPGPELPALLNRLEREHDNLRAALSWTMETDAAETGLRIAASVGWLWLLRGHFAEGDDWLTRLLATPDAASPTRCRSKVLHWAAEMAWHRGDPQRVVAFRDEQLAIARALGDPKELATALSERGWVANLLDDFDRAERLFEESIALRRASDDWRDLADTLNNLGSLAFRRGQFDNARRHYEEGVALLREKGGRFGLTALLHNLGLTARHEGDVETAAACWQAALEIAIEVGDLLHRRSCSQGLERIAFDQGDFAAAEGYLEDLLQIARRQEDIEEICELLARRGRIACYRGDLETAHMLGEQSVIMARRQDHQGRLAAVLMHRAAVLRTAGDFEQAEALYRECLTIHQAEMAARRPDTSDPQAPIAACLEGWADIVLTQGDPLRAARALGAAAAMRERVRHLVPPVDQEWHASLVAKAHAALGEPTFEAAFAEGCALSVADAVAASV